MSETPAPSSADAYLLKAEECTRLAAAAEEPSVKAALETAARGWRVLADQSRTSPPS